MENKEAIGFQLLKIESSEFAILEPELTSISKIKIQTGLRFAVSDINNMVACQVTIEFLLEKSQKLLKLKTDNQFKVKPEDWDKMKSENFITLPKGFMAHLATISVSTARGILHCKTENTVYNKFILPLVNVVEMIPTDEKFEL